VLIFLKELVARLNIHKGECDENHGSAG
jgi:hypothetical protein